MWKLEDFQKLNSTQACINGKWVPARPLNGKKEYASFLDRLKDAWEVFQCRAEAFKWPEGQ